MNFLKSLVKGTPPDPTSKVAEILPISHEPSSCNPSLCHHSYSTNCFKLDAAAEVEPLWETADSADLHLLVSTESTDWQRDPFDAPGTVLGTIKNVLNEGEKIKKLGLKLRISATSLPLKDNEEYAIYKDQQKCDILVMPWFIWMKGITSANFENTLVELLTILNDGQDNLPSNIGDVTIEKDPARSYVFLCSHRTRDKKCGITAPIMKKEFDSNLRDLGLYRDIGDNRPGGVNVVFINHVGGHKFAANILIYNKGGEFIWYARCTPLNVKPIIDEAVLKGTVFPELARNVQKYASINW
ncbi:hypothetical protein CANARDRAFT_198696 [[Candida] arabinofermentans NRRL YB-2248]|uniref:Actin patches distal protein 1 n=1 Tax=[Candida] arabinofermentans NRRL YB-2248 TaxID=983967 RepID=A0A1E4T1H5_9ASCO|nr:hypothetical protein CANARDRAFT_198696 [[Candida] arabinofermentans NRRL YB-2248]